MKEGSALQDTKIDSTSKIEASEWYRDLTDQLDFGRPGSYSNGNREVKTERRATIVDKTGKEYDIPRGSSVVIYGEQRIGKRSFISRATVFVRKSSLQLTLRSNGTVKLTNSARGTSHHTGSRPPRNSGALN